jgi:hypothetical protein
LSDEIDAAQEEIDRLQEMGLKSARSNLVKLKPRGHCYNCDEALQLADQLFCDADCAHDYERREWASKMRP